MASSLDFIEFACEQIRSPYPVRYRKMFGDYMIYINDKPLLLVCNDTVYVKKLDYLLLLLGGAPTGVPYTGAKEHYILDIENLELVSSVIELLEANTVFKPKKKK